MSTTVCDYKARGALQAHLQEPWFFNRPFESVDQDMIAMAQDPFFNVDDLMFFLQHGANVNYINTDPKAPKNEQTVLMAALHIFDAKTLSVPLVKAILDAKLTTDAKVAPFEFEECVSQSENSDFKDGYLECLEYMLQKQLCTRVT